MTDTSRATTKPDVDPWRARLQQCVTKLQIELKAMHDDIECGAANQHDQPLPAAAAVHLRATDSLAGELRDLLDEGYDAGRPAHPYGRCCQCGQPCQCRPNTDPVVPTEN